MDYSCEHLFRHLETKRLKESKFNNDKQMEGTYYICIDRFYCQKCLDIKEVRESEYIKVFNKIPKWFRN